MGELERRKVNGGERRGKFAAQQTPALTVRVRALGGSPIPRGGFDVSEDGQPEPLGCWLEGDGGRERVEARGRARVEGGGGPCGRGLDITTWILVTGYEAHAESNTSQPCGNT